MEGIRRHGSRGPESRGLDPGRVIKGESFGHFPGVAEVGRDFLRVAQNGDLRLDNEEHVFCFRRARSFVLVEIFLVPSNGGG